MFKRINNIRSLLFLFLSIIIVLLLFIFYNFTSLTQGNWFFHPDERDIYSFGEQFYYTGRLYYLEPLNKVYSINAFTPDGSTNISEKIVPARSIGLILLITPFFLFGPAGPFYAVSTCGLLLILFVFLLVRKLFGQAYALYSTVLFGLSPPVIYWNNMLFSNIPALSFFVVGIYFSLIEKRLYQTVLTAVFFSLAIYMRYEYVISIALYFLVYIIYFKNKQAFIRLLILGVWTLLFLAPILLINKNIYGNYFSFGYTQKGYDFTAGKSIDYSINTQDKGLALLSKYITRFGGQFTNSKMFVNIAVNTEQYILNLVPILSILGVSGLIYFLKFRSKEKYIILLLIVLSLFNLIYFGAAGNYNGFGKSWLSSSYSRYFLIIYLLFAIVGSFVYSRIKRINRSIAILLLSSAVIFNIISAYLSPFGLRDTGENKYYYKYINDAVSRSPEDTVVISNFYSKAIISRNVFIPRLLQVPSNQINQNTLDYSSKLLAEHHIYLIENPNHSSFLNLLTSFQKDSRFRIHTVDEKNFIYEILEQNS